MLRHAKACASVLLPILPLALCQGCGVDSSEHSSTASLSAPAVASVSGNLAPTIARVTDEYARVGATYTYAPMAEDPEGDALQFSATNLPPWASIDPASGRISGTPGPNDQGIYESITIAVADGARKAETAPFSISVIEEQAAVGELATGVASLHWEVPPSKVDGSPLDDLSGYRILYGRSSSDLDKSVLIDDPAVTSFEFATLPKGIWYFAVVAVNAGGLEGPPTTITMKSI